MLVRYFAGYFFFFKQKTAYEMRISDWSSDVCSSDLFQTRRRYSLNAREEVIDCLDDFKWIAIGRGRDPDEYGAMPFGHGVGVIILTPKLDSGDIAKTHLPARRTLHHHVPEIINAPQIGGGSDIDCRVLALDLARR